MLSGRVPSQYTTTSTSSICILVSPLFCSWYFWIVIYLHTYSKLRTCTRTVPNTMYLLYSQSSERRDTVISNICAQAAGCMISARCVAQLVVAHLVVVGVLGIGGLGFRVAHPHLQVAYCRTVASACYNIHTTVYYTVSTVLMTMT